MNAGSGSPAVQVGRLCTDNVRLICTCLPAACLPACPRLGCRVLVEIQPVACIVDESLAVDSSSSDDEDAEVAEHRRDRRAAAAAARPSGSTMPGWIGRVQQCTGRSSSRLWSPGRLCRVQAWVAQQQDCATTRPDWQQAVQAAAEELAAGLAAAGLAAADVASCKVYCIAGLLESQQQPGLTVAALREAVAAVLPGVQPAVVPASAVGASPAADCDIMLEALATSG